MRGGICMKLIVAVLRKEDEVDTIAELNKKGFFVTELATTGGFLKEKNTTLLIGTDDHKLDAVLAILKQEAGLRKTVTYAATPMESGNFCPGGNYSVPIDTQTGGCTVGKPSGFLTNCVDSHFSGPLPRHKFRPLFLARCTAGTKPREVVRGCPRSSVFTSTPSESRSAHTDYLRSFSAKYPRV